MIRLLDLPGAQQLEARLELLPHLTASNDARTRDLLNSVLDPLGFKVDWTGWIEMPEMEPGEEPIDLDAHSPPYYAPDVVAFWRRRGWDIAGADGKPVQFFQLISRAMILIEEGRAGLSKMKVEASLWRRERNDNAPADPKAKKQDQSFLDLGRRGRRGRAA